MSSQGDLAGPRAGSRRVTAHPTSTWDSGRVTDVGGAPRTGRRGRPGFDQETVLRRAIALFNQQGYDATSIGDLAKDLGLTKSAIYHHVDSKEDLLAAALDEALDELNAAIEVAVAAPAGTSAAQRLRTAVEESVRVLV